MNRRASLLACPAVAKRRLVLALLLVLVLDRGAISFAQEETSAAAPEAPSTSSSTTSAPSEQPAATSQPAAAAPQPTPFRDATPAKRGWVGRIMHPFSGGAPAPPPTRDPKLRGLVLDLQVSPQTVKLSEVRQLEIKVTVTNRGKRAVTLDFPNDQRIDIYLMNSAEIVLTRWSDNHAIKERPGTLLINPQEHVEYNETISTRELTPDKVFIAEAFFPKYPELRARQKFLTAP